MNNYITVISKDEFINLYRFATINLNKDFLLIANENNIKKKLIELFKRLPFREANDYLIIEIEDQEYNENFLKPMYQLNLQKIEKFEVLSEQAQRFYKTKVNPKLSYDLTYQSILPKIKKYHELKDMKRGTEIIFEQFDVKYNEENNE